MLKQRPNAVINTQVLFQGFLTEHNLPIAVNDHFSKLTSRMFPDSEIACEYSCDRTKATHSAYTIASDSVKGVKKGMLQVRSHFIP